MRKLPLLLTLLMFLATNVTAAPKPTPKPTPATSSSAKRPAKISKTGKASSKKKGPEKSAKPKTLPEAMVGKWKQIGGEDTVEFTKAGTMIAANSQLQLEGKYTVTNDGELAVDLGLAHITHGPIKRKVALHDGQLTITDEHNVVMKYTRVP